MYSTLGLLSCVPLATLIFQFHFLHSTISVKLCSSSPPLIKSSTDFVMFFFWPLHNWKTSMWSPHMADVVLCRLLPLLTSSAGYCWWWQETVHVDVVEISRVKIIFNFNNEKSTEVHADTNLDGTELFQIHIDQNRVKALWTSGFFRWLLNWCLENLMFYI